MLKKHKDRATEGHKRKEAEFIVKKEDLFNVAHADQEADQDPGGQSLPLDQREKVRRGVISSVGKLFATNEVRLV